MTDAKTIKIMIITPTLQCGGSEKFVWQLCSYLDSNLFHVRLIVLNNKQAFYTIDKPGVDVVDLQESRVRYSLFKIKKQVELFEPELVLSTANHLNIYLAIFRSIFPAKTKFIARESSIVSVNSKRATAPLLYNQLIKKFYRRFDCIVCQSRYMQQDLVEQYRIPETKTAIIANAVQASPQNNVATNQIDKVNTFLTVARLSPEKGIGRLIHAVGLLSIPFKFFIIGEGSEKARLQNLIHELHLDDQVFLIGEKPNPFTGFEQADLFLMGSYYEGFPNALIEAGALGIPAVAFDVPGGIPEIIEDGTNGFLVEDNDIIQFAGTINKALLNKIEKNTLAEEFKQRFSIQQMIASYKNLFLKFARNK